MGWKKTIKKIVKGSKNRRIKLKVLRKQLRKLHDSSAETKIPKSDFKEIFERKVQKANRQRLRVEGEELVYTGKDI